MRHNHVFDAVLGTLEATDFQVQRMQLSLSQDDARFFGTLDLLSTVAEGVALAVGVRNSIDKTFPLGFCAGSRVFVCDNLAFRSELLVARKHTLHGGTRFREAIALAVHSLGQFRDTEAQRIDRMKVFPLSDMHAESLMLQAYARGLVSHRALPHVIEAWRQPAHAAFEGRNLWSLLNAFTGAIQGRARSNPQQFALQSIRLQALLCPSEN